MMDNQSSTTSMIIAHFLDPDSEGGCGGESVNENFEKNFVRKILIHVVRGLRPVS
jgi:hypothetical protein